MWMCNPLLPTLIWPTLSGLSQMLSLITITIVWFFHPGFGTSSYFNVQKQAIGLPINKDPNWSSIHCLVTDAQSVLQVLVTSLPLNVVGRLLTWFEEFATATGPLTKGSLLENRLDITTILNVLYCRLYSNLANGLLLLSVEEKAKLIPVLSLLHEDKQDKEDTIKVLILILHLLPSLKGFLLMVHLIGLGSPYWKLQHFMTSNQAVVLQTSPDNRFSSW